jgi:hypothetical protein
MEGGYAPRFPSLKICRSRRMVALAASSLLSLAANWAIADDSPALRPLARRYADPSQLFEAEETDIEFKQVVVAEKSFRVPPPPTPPIRFAMEEPPAFVSSAHLAHSRFEAAPALSTLSPIMALKISQPQQNEPLPVAVATEPSSDHRPAPPPQNYQRPLPLSSQRPADIVVRLQPQPTEPTNKIAAPVQPTQSPVATAPQSYQRPFPLAAQRPPQVVVRVQPQPIEQTDDVVATGQPAQSTVATTPQSYQRPFPLSAQRPPQVVVQAQPQPVEQTDDAVATGQATQSTVSTPPQNYQRPFPLSAQQPSQVVVRFQPQPVAQPVEATVPAQPAQTPVAAASQTPAVQHPVFVASETQATQSRNNAAPSPQPPPGRVVMASAPADDASAPPVRFYNGEPPAFQLQRLPQPQPAYVPMQAPAHMVAPIPVTMSAAESPSLTIPAPPTADMVPDAPAFSSTADPLNITIGAVADQPPPPAPGIDASAAAAQSGAPGSLGEVEKLGDAPPSNTLQFLRQDAVLLKPGQTQYDWGLNYSIYNFTGALPVVNGSGTVVGVTNERIRLQLMSIPFAVRYGICDGLQGYVNLPLGWSNDETTTDIGESHTNNFVSMGDISAGLNYQIMKGCGAYRPDVIASVGFIAPTGHATFATSLLAPTSALGQGFWDITCSVLAVHTLDPVIFYYGGGYVHRFDASFGDNLEVDPGQEFDYVFGVGFAVNPWVTISGTFIGNYITRYGVNDVSLPGSDLDLLRFRVSCTLVKDKHICEPFGEIGMTPDTPSRVGITFTY